MALGTCAPHGCRKLLIGSKNRSALSLPDQIEKAWLIISHSLVLEDTEVATRLLRELEVRDVFSITLVNGEGEGEGEGEGCWRLRGEEEVWVVEDGGAG